MFLCEDCRIDPGVVWVEGIVLCASCFSENFGVSWDSIKAAKYCPSCETKVAGVHRCQADSVDAQGYIDNIKIKEN